MKYLILLFSLLIKFILGNYICRNKSFARDSIIEPINLHLFYHFRLYKQVIMYTFLLISTAIVSGATDSVTVSAVGITCT